MADFCGWDIGGAHLKLSRLRCAGDSHSIATRIASFEIWREPAGLAPTMRALLQDAAVEPGAAHAVTMTAELSDVFPTKVEGVRSILRACTEALPPGRRVLDRQGALIDFGEAMERPLDVAAANWAATARLVGRAARNALLVDVGSTTTDIIPVRDGEPCPKGRSDTGRLQSGELVYSGVLRTPPASLCEVVPLGGGVCRVAPEHFTTMGDVYLILGSITAEEFTSPTADGRGRTPKDAMARLARLVCADLDEIGSAAVEVMAAFLRDRQIDRLAQAIVQVLSRRECEGITTAITAGAGAFLADEAARRAGLAMSRLASLVPAVQGKGWDRSGPAAALAMLMASDNGVLRFTT